MGGRIQSVIIDDPSQGHSSMPMLVRPSLLLLVTIAVAMAAEYHLAITGDDAHDGRSPASAWRSLSRIPVADLRPGDRVVLRSGDRFTGMLALTHGGNQQQPVTVTRSGAEPAVIVAEPGKDALVISASHVVVSGLQVIGPGTAAGGHADGVRMSATVEHQRLAGIVLRDLRITGFPAYGIQVAADAAGAGCDDLLVENCEATANGEAGMGSWGPCTPGSWAHRRITVRGCRFFDNRGLPEKKDNHSGNGIILGDVQDALIEHCSAWGNGADCHFSGGGPVGIWLCEAEKSVIRNCLSLHNHTGAPSVDGGGFDLDGGCSNCRIEGCLSWRNDGAGYLVCQYQGARAFRDNEILNCWSVGDGRAHGYAALHLWCDPAGSVRNTKVTGCSLVMDATPQGSACVTLATPADGLSIEGNVMVSLAGAWLLRGGEQAGCTVVGNRWLANGPAKACRADQSPSEPPAGTTTLAGAWAIPDTVDLAWLKRLAGAMGGGAGVETSWGAESVIK
jgi:Right handed beta helix region